MAKEDLEGIEEEDSNRGIKKVLAFLFFALVVGLLTFYWFFPFQEIEFNSVASSNSNFSINNSELVEMQFYENMRYPSSNISYRIEDCTLAKKNNMERAFEILENETVLNFYSVENNEEIIITCSEEIQHAENPSFFVAGEGGPTKIIPLENFNLILSGKVLLLRESKCSKPNVGIHELLHALGFNHSSNPGNIMYPVTKCSQTLGGDIPQLLNDLYSYPSHSDLTFGNASAYVHSKYLDLNFSVKNEGLIDSEEFEVVVYLNNNSLERYELEKIGPGEGRRISLRNLRISEFKVNEIKLIIEANFSELNKENNRIKLKVNEN